MVGAQIIAPDAQFAREFAAQLRKQNSKNSVTLLAEYVEKQLAPSGGRPHRSLLLLFRGEDPYEKLVTTCGHMHSEKILKDIDSFTGESIRDTYADLITDGDSDKVQYFEPAVITPRNKEAADEDFRLFLRHIKGMDNIVQNYVAPDDVKIERTLVMIKPDNWEHPSSKPGTIIDIFARTGLRIVGIKVQRFSLNAALDFYGPVEGALKKKLAPKFGEKAKTFLEEKLNLRLSDEALEMLTKTVGTEYALDQFYQIVNYMSGTRPDRCPKGDEDKPGSVMCLVLIYEGESAIDKIRAVLGSTDPSKAASGTVRRDFGHDVMENTAHASDSPESYQREAGIVKVDENAMCGLIEEYLQHRA
jgi:nucleoside diphosphate kinase